MSVTRLEQRSRQEIVNQARCWEQQLKVANERMVRAHQRIEELEAELAECVTVEENLYASRAAANHRTQALETELARVRAAMGGDAVYANVLECVEVLEPLDTPGEPNTLLALAHKAVAELARVGEIAAGADDGGHWYSQQTMDAVSGERDTLRAELARVREVMSGVNPHPLEKHSGGLEKGASNGTNR